MRPRTHNIISYGIALLVFVAVFSLRRAGNHNPGAPAALLATALWCLHFARRTAEAAWVHRYGKQRIPTGDIVVEYVYYWGFAAWIAFSLGSPSYHGPSTLFLGVGSVVFLLAELGNAKAHRMLRDLRPAGTSARVIPRGFLFERVSCPHYLFEILSWVGFAIVTQIWASLGFLLLGAGILGAWAHARHVAYRKDFDGQDGRVLYPTGRRALIPFLF